MCVHSSKTLLLSLAGLLTLTAWVLSEPLTPRIQTYKTVGDVTLSLHMFEPSGRAGQPRPAMVFFFGGGWVGGSIDPFYPHCEHLAAQGVVAIAADYRVRSRHNTTPFECVKDGKSAIRWVRAHASELGIDPGRIAAAGGSAGGHVAACTAILTGMEEEGENLEISSRPNLLALFNPVIDTSPQGFGDPTLKDRWEILSPTAHVRPGLCSTIIFHGAADTTVSIASVRRFETLMRQQGNPCQLVEYAGQKHGFFNKGPDEDKYYELTLAALDEFLTRHGWIEPADPVSEEAINRRIERYRTAEVTLTVTGADGQPLAEREVALEQTRHQFLFGCNGFKLNPAEETDYNHRFRDLFNAATLGFYWSSYERTSGQDSRERLLAMAQWCQANHIAVKGHPLCWHQTMPGWANELEVEPFRALQMERISREVRMFAETIDYWDVINEVAATPNYRTPNNVSRLCNEIGRDQLVREVFAAARQAGPDKKLIINDYDTSEQAVAIVDRALHDGVGIDRVGIQSHMHTRYWGARQLWEVSQRFARFGRPLHFTELTILSGPEKANPDWNRNHPDWNGTPEGETLQASRVEETYRMLYSHPMVEAIVWWDLSDQDAWMGAPAGLIRKDMSPKPAYEVLRRLIKREWWTPSQTLKTDARGQITLRVSLGDFQVSAPGAIGNFSVRQAKAQSVPVILRPGS